MKKLWIILSLPIAAYGLLLGWHHLLDDGCSGRSLAHQTGEPASHWAQLLLADSSTAEEREFAIYGLAATMANEEESLWEYLQPNCGHDPLCLFTPSHWMDAIDGLRAGYESDDPAIVRVTLLSRWWAPRDPRETARILARLDEWSHPEAEEIRSAFQARMSTIRFPPSLREQFR